MSRNNPKPLQVGDEVVVKFGPNHMFGRRDYYWGRKSRWLRARVEQVPNGRFQRSYWLLCYGHPQIGEAIVDYTGAVGSGRNPKLWSDAIIVRRVAK